MRNLSGCSLENRLAFRFLPTIRSNAESAQSGCSAITHCLILTGHDLPLAVEPDQKSSLASFPSASHARKQPARSIRCRRRPRWKRQAGRCGRWRRIYFREHGASSSRRALVDRIVVRSALNSLVPRPIFSRSTLRLVARDNFRLARPFRI